MYLASYVVEVEKILVEVGKLQDSFKQLGKILLVVEVVVVITSHIVHKSVSR